MPRGRRLLVEGGLYHVYNRFARGEDAFADPEEAVEFSELLREVKQRDGPALFAWAIGAYKRGEFAPDLDENHE